ncbi:AraC family transcriptional regulator [Paenibacillus campi]|uniref:AraC family transcriptional regulator n=1 Tax=Paenibacillus campi TaxID=3106031 RepID=UPI002B002984|nr:AraC family transcriptional regulator [Paenibacillus sp. SGZ-1009]
MLSKNWYRRLLLSYFPIFLLTISMLIFLSFIVINEISKKETARADRISTSYMLDTIERSVQEIEMDVLRDVQTSPVYDQFLAEKDTGNTGVTYQVVEHLRQLMDNNELLQSVYVYRNSDQSVLTVQGLQPLTDFRDEAFIKRALAEPEQQGWSTVRSFAEMSGDQQRQVISMHKRLPLPFGDQGMLVINVSVYGLQQLAASMVNSQVSFLTITDAASQQIYPPVLTEQDTNEHDQPLTVLHSKRLGWTLESGLRAGQLFAWVSVISYIWVLIGVLVVLASIAYIIYITRKNYKPIQVMMQRIESLQLSAHDSPRKDEMALIDQALESLIEQTVDYERQHHENLLIHRRRLFMNWIEGEPPEQLQHELERLRIFPELTGHSETGAGLTYAFIVAEIQDYDAFREKGNSQEYNTLKLALTNVFQELAQQDGVYGWSEWISVRRAGIIIVGEGDERQWMRLLFSLAAGSKEWVEQHLHLPMIFGTGVTVKHSSELHLAYETAVESMKYSMTLGRDGVVMYSDLPEGGEPDSYRYLQAVSDWIKEFRLRQPEWRDRLQTLLGVLEDDVLRDDSIRSLVLSLLQMLTRELEGMSEPLDRLLASEQADAVMEQIAHAETVDELQIVLMPYLEQVYHIYAEAGDSTNQRALIGEMKAYMEAHFANPDLSLNHLSERFNVTPKYVSHLFKAELDVKFIDLLVQLRLQRAEKLLYSTDDTIQNIAIQVGYANSITFGRVFKRIIGVTPGDYRKLKMKPGSLIPPPGEQRK